MITPKGSEPETPGSCAKRTSSRLADAERDAGEKATGNDRNPATSAAAMAASTRLVIVATWSSTIGAMRMAAMPARAEPIAQLAVGDEIG